LYLATAARILYGGRFTREVRQKGAALIALDHRSASLLTTGILALGLSLASTPAALADENDAPIPATSAPATSVSSDTSDETDNVSTQTATAAADAPAAPGTKIENHPERTIVIYIDNDKRVVRSAAPSVRDLLAEQRIAFGPHDEVTPALGRSPAPRDIVRITRVDVWTVRERKPVAPLESVRDDATLAAGKTLTLDPGQAGVRETTLRFERRGDANVRSFVIASHLIRAPRERIVERGIADYSALANVAERGFTSALHFARTALHMIATAYTAGCYGCSGITASGSHAGFGIIAVDPNVIPLGTKLFIPGYGRAVAGDTGGAIHGHRVDLGMNTVSEALRFGRRAVTVYVLR
jgi:3D (Asp-Asp-Asp) domain-containing protein